MKVRSLIAVVLGSAATLTACGSNLEHSNPYDPATAPALQAKATLTGQVTLEGESDFSGTLVGLANTSVQTQTNPDGTFTLTGIPAGQYDVLLSRPSYQSETIPSVSFPLGASASKSIGTVALQLKRAVVAGSVVLQGQSVSSGALVTLTRTGRPTGAPPQGLSGTSAPPATGSVVLSTLSDASGGYQFGQVPAGTYDLNITKDQFSPAAQTGINVSGDGAVTVNPLTLLPLAGDFLIDNGAAYTNQATVTLDFSVQNVAKVEVSEDAAFGGGATWTAYAGNVAFSLSAGDGTKTIYARFQDLFGNVTAVKSQSIVLDTTPPFYSAIALNGGATYSTTGGSVNVTLDALDATSGVASMQVWEPTVVSSPSTQPFVPALVFPISLASGDGVPVVVDARFEDRAGNWGPIVTAAVIVDTVAPVASRFAILGAPPPNNTVTNSAVVTVSLAATGATQMQISSDSGFGGATWIPYATSVGWTLSSGDGSKTLYARFEDAAGNVSTPPNSASITLQTQPPLVLSAGLDPSAKPATTSPAVRFAFNVSSGTQAVQMRISERSDFLGAVWVPYATSPVTTLSSGDGYKTLYFQFEDALGNQTAVFSDATNLDTTPPVLSSVLIDGGAAYKTDNGAGVSVALSAQDAGSGVGTMAVWQVGGPPPSAQSFATPILFAPNPATGDGVAVTIAARVWDRAGNASAQVTASIVVDTTPPVASSFAILGASGNTVTNSTVVTLSLAATGASEMEISADSGFAGATWIPYAPTVGWTLSSGDGSKTLYARFEDAAGNVSTPPNSASITLQTQPPQVFSAGLLPSEKPAVTAPTVTLSFNVGASVAQMEISERSDFSTGTGWTAYGSSPTYALSSGDGLKTLYFRFRDALDNETSVLSDSTTLDTTAPQLSSFTLNGGAAYKTDGGAAVSVSLNAFDGGSGVATMAIWELPGGPTGAQSFSTPVLFALSPSTGDGVPVTVAGRVWDRAGNASAQVTASIVVDTVAPTLGSPALQIQGSGGSASTNNPNVTLLLSASGATQMEISNDSGFGGATWMGYATQAAWTLAPADGGKTVYARFQDAAGNQTAPVQQSITLQTTPPVVSAAEIVSSEKPATSSSTINLAFVVSGLNPMTMRISERSDFSTGTGWIGYAPTPAIAVSGGDGLKALYFQFQDAAGNQTSVLNDLTTLDATAPQLLSLTINGGAIYKSLAGGSVSVALNAQDAGSGVAAMQIWEPAVTTAPVTQSYLPQSVFPISVSSGDGLPLVVDARVEDAAGNWSAIATAGIVVDTVAPTLGAPALQILGSAGSSYTNTANVTLLLSASGATQMEISNDSGFGGASWIAYATQAAWLLPSGDGSKAVYARFEDDAGNQTSSVGQTIVLQTQPPQVSSAAILSGEKPATNAATVSLIFSVSGLNPLQMRIAENAAFTGASWQPYAATPTWALSSGDGLKTLYFQFEDAAGNETAVLSDLTTLDTTAPSSAMISVAGGGYTKSQQVNVSLSAVGADEMIVSESPAFSGASWQPYATALVYALSATDGPKTIYVEYRDRAGNLSPTAYASVVLDTTAPAAGSPAVALNGTNPTYVTTPLVEVTVNATGADQMMVSNDQSFATTTWQAYASSVTGWSLTGGDGTKTVYVKIRDFADNEIGPYSVSTILDTVPPANPMVSIDGGAGQTNTTAVTLALSASGASQMLLGNDPAFTGSVLEPYGTTATWTLASGDGSKTVYAEFLDAAGNVSSIAQASITLKTSAPSAPTVTIDGGGAWTDTVNVTLGLYASGAVSMSLGNTASASDTGWIAFGSTYAWALLGGDGPKWVYVKYEDGAGNIAGPVSAGVTLDTTAPTAPSIAFEGGASLTNSTLVTLVLSAGGATSMEVSNDSGFAGSSWVAYATTYAWALPTGDGTKTVYARFQDAAGNQTLPVQQSITLDTTPPSSPSVAINAGALYAATTSVVLSLDAVGASGVEIANDAAFSAPTTVTFSGPATQAWTLPAGDGLKTVYARYFDAAGNPSVVASAQITLDTAAPTSPSLSLNGGAAYTDVRTVDLSLNAIGATEMIVANDPSFAGSSWSSFAFSLLGWTLPATDGVRTVYARFRDDAGNLSVVVTASITLDTTPPSVGSPAVSVNAGTTYVHTTLVVLGLDVTGADEMLVANDASFGGAQWQPVTSSIPWILTSGDGTKNVYAEFRDRAGNTVGPYGASVVLDTVPPSSPALSITPASYASTTSVSLTLSAVGATLMKVANDIGFTGASVTAYATTLPWSLTSGDGTKSVYAEFLDDAGNVSQIVYASVLLKTSYPTLSTVSLNQGAAFTSSVAIVASLAASSDAVQMLLGSDPSFSGSLWEPFAPNSTFLLAGGDGTKTVYAQVRDVAQNASSVATASIVLDTTAPTAPRIQTSSETVNLPAPSYTFSVSLAVTSSDANFLGYQVKGGQTYADWTTLVVPPGTDNFTFSLFPNAQNRLSLRAIDRAGNVSGDDSVSITEDSAAPDAPSDVSVENGNQKVTVHWSASVSSDVAGYLLFYGPASGVYTGTFANEGPSPINVGNVTGFKLTGLPDGTQFYVSLKAYDAAGNRSGYSQEVIAEPNYVSPVRVGGFNPGGSQVISPTGLDLSGSTLFVTEGPASLLALFDLTSPDNPTLLGSVDTREYDDDVRVVGGRAQVMEFSWFGGDTNRIETVNVSIPGAPSVQGSVVQPPGAWWQGPFDATSTRLVVGASSWGGGAPGLQIYDSSGPSPLFLGGYPTQSSMSYQVQGVRLSGSTVYTLAYGQDPVTFNWACSLQIFDLSTPSSPFLEGSATVASWCDSYNEKNIFLDSVGGKAYVPGNQWSSNALQIVDVSSPTNPMLLGSYPTFGGPFTVVGSYLYEAQRPNWWNNNVGGLYVYDVSNASAPLRLQSSPFAYVAAPNPADIVVSGTRAYIADRDAGLVVVDVSNPASPSTVKTLGFAAALRVDGTGALTALAYGSEGLVLMDTENPTAPKVITSYMPIGAGAVNDVKIVGRFAYLAAGAAGISVVDLSVPTMPVTVTTYKPNSYGYDSVDVQRGRLYALSANTGGVCPPSCGDLDVMDITNVGTGMVPPVSVIDSGVWTYDGRGRALKVRGDLLVAGTSLFSIQYPTAPPQFIGPLPITTANAVEITADTIYAAGPGPEGAGVYISSAPCITCNPLSGGSLNQFIRTPGVPMSLKLAGTYLYAGDTVGLQVLDVSGSAPGSGGGPLLVGTSASLVPSFTFDLNAVFGITIQGNFAYLANGGLGLSVFELADPSIPALLNSKFSWGNSNLIRMAMSGPYLYTLDTGPYRGLIQSNMSNAYAFSYGSLNANLASGASDMKVRPVDVFVSQSTAGGGIQVVDASCDTAGFMGCSNAPLGNPFLFAPVQAMADDGDTLYAVPTTNAALTCGLMAPWAATQVEGVAVQSTLNYPNGVTVDPRGNVYFADMANNRVRKVFPNGIITTVAGYDFYSCQASGWNGGLAICNSLDAPTDVILDGAGNLYIAESGANAVRRVDVNGYLSTVAGMPYSGCLSNGDGGPATSAGLCTPYGLATDYAGRLYISDQGACVVRKVGLNNVIATTVGTPFSCGAGSDGVPPTATLLNRPSHVVTDGVSLFIADTQNHVVRRVIGGGMITTYAGTMGVWGNGGDGSPAASAYLYAPTGVALDPAGNLVIADTGNCRLRKVDRLSQVISNLAGSASGFCGGSGDGGPAGSAELDGPYAARASGDGTLVVSSTLESRVRRIDPAGVIHPLAGIPFQFGSNGDGNLDGSLRVVTNYTSFPTEVGIINARNGQNMYYTWACYASRVTLDTTVSSISVEGTLMALIENYYPDASFSGSPTGQALVLVNTAPLLAPPFPQEATVVGRYDEPTNPNLGQVALYGKHAYVTRGSGQAGSLQEELLVFDVSNPANPNIVGRYSSTNGFHAPPIFLSGRFVSLIDSAGMSIIDVVNPAGPVLRSSWFDALIPSFWIAGPDAFVANTNTVKILNLQP